MTKKNVRPRPKNIQEWMEVNVWALLIVLLVVLSIGGIIEIVPLFTMKSTMEYNSIPEIIWKRTESQSLTEHAPGDGIRPYTALELVGRDIYLREGCYTCHSQMIRPFRDEKERYGHYSLASESMYDHPFQWGSKRTGPDLARLGGKYSDDWHRKHLRAPRSVVLESVMPNYPWLQNTPVNTDIQIRMGVMRLLGVPYKNQDIIHAPIELRGKTEEDALISYLQVLGTMVKLEEGKVYRE